MDNEIKQHLDSAGFKFKDIDENGIEKEMTLSEMIESLIENNGKLGDLLCQKSKEVEQSNNKLQKYKNAIYKIKTYINSYSPYFLETQEENNKKIASIIHEELE